jgi:amino acid transporter
MVAEARAEELVEQSTGTLRRELKFWEAIALSIGIMAPTAAMALNGVAPAGLIGRAVPLAFLFAAVAIALVSYAFVRLTSFFNHAGSAYALAGATIGPRAGFFACFALLGTYTTFTIASTAEVGLFSESFFQGTGIWNNPEWIVISLIALAIIWFVAYGDIKIGTRALLSMEGLSVTLITILVIVIFYKLLDHSAPNGQTFSFKPFVPVNGTTVGAIAFASVFGLLSFGGFEGAAALGEETNKPKRNIPLAIAVAVAFTGIFYTIVMFAQSLGFGIGAAGVKAFSSSAAPLGDLSKSYVGNWMANLLDLGAMISAFASALGTATGASRLLFALGRDGFITRRLGDASPRTGAPAKALFVIIGITLVTVLALRSNGTNATNVFFYLGTIGVLSMLIAYVVVNLGALKFLHLGRREAPWRAIIPVLAISALVYTFYKNVWPQPAYPYDVFPFLVAGWVIVGALITVVFPKLAKQVGAGLAETVGTADTATEGE